MGLIYLLKLDCTFSIGQQTRTAQRCQSAINRKWFWGFITFFLARFLNVFEYTIEILIDLRIHLYVIAIGVNVFL